MSGVGQNVRAVPRWSVMIPAYRPDRALLEEALQSVLVPHPEMHQMQIEVVDDASPDMDVARMVREIAPARVAVFRRSRNGGLAACWNTCIARARGELVHLLHQDDSVRPGFYGRMESLMRACPQAVYGFCRHEIINDDGTRWLSELERDTPGLIENWLPRICVQQRIQCASVVVRRAAYAKVGGFRADLPYVLDWEMWIRLAAHGPVAFEPHVLAVYRRHAGSQTNRLMRSGKAIRDVIRLAWLQKRIVGQQLYERLSPDIWRGAAAWVSQAVAQDMYGRGAGELALLLGSAAVWFGRAGRWGEACMCARWAAGILKNGVSLGPV